MRKTLWPPAPLLPPLPEGELNAWHFDGKGWQRNPKTAPRTLVRAEFVPSRSGQALRMRGAKRALAAFAATNKAGSANLLNKGSVRFWFAPDWSSSSSGGTGPRQPAVLFETGAWASDNGFVHCSLQMDADGNSIRFVLDRPGGLETILTAPIAWMRNEWHQLALVSTATSTVLYLDGKAVANGNAMTLLPAPLKGRVNGFCVGSDVAGRALAQGDFDELYTFERELTANEVALDYNRNSSAATLGPAKSRAALAPSSLTGTNVTFPGTNMVAARYDCQLWLEIRGRIDSPKNVLVTLHNTVPGWNYKLWSRAQLGAPQAWTLEKDLWGAPSQNFISTNIAMKGRSNLFFVATALGGFVTNKGFAGLQFTNTTAGNPDAMGAAGPDHYVAIVNALQGTRGVAVYDKCSGLLTQSLASTQFFAVQFGGTNVPLGNLVDARIVYDSHAQRWVAFALAQNPQKAVILAVSKNSSPLDLATNWTKYFISFPYAGINPDYPTLGVDQNGIYLSVYEQSFPGGVEAVASNVVVAIKKPEIYQGTNISTRLVVTTNDLHATIIQPAVSFDTPPRGQYAWFVAKQWRGNESNYLGGALAYRRLRWSGSNAVWADTNWVSLTNSFYRNYFDLDDGRIRAPQTNGFPAINLFQTGSRLMMAFIHDGALWTCHHVGLSGTNGTYSGGATGTNVDRSAAQWLKISTDTNGNFLSLTNGRVFDRSRTTPYYYYFPSLAVNQAGDMVMGFSGSRTNGYIGAFYSYRAANGTVPNAPLVLKPGLGPFDSFRWGDYSYTTVDPVDGLTFWTVQQYAGDDPDANPWGTWISEIVPDVPKVP
ncbi:MAG TPA: LamG-like jellyroll fold domain-containing protein [Verrucomicrobiae bacterium]